MKETGTGESITELARRHGRSREVIRNYCLELDQTGKRGNAKLYDPAAMGKLLASRPHRKPKSADVEALENRKLRLQCEKLEVEINARRARLIPREDVENFYTFHTATVSRLTTKLAHDVAPKVKGQSVAKTEKILDAAGEELIAVLRKGDWLGDDVGVSDDAEVDV